MDLSEWVQLLGEWCEGLQEQTSKAKTKMHQARGKANSRQQHGQLCGSDWSLLTDGSYKSIEATIKKEGSATPKGGPQPRAK